MQLNKKTLIQSGGGTGPMKPGNRALVTVLIPAENFLEDESRLLRFLFLAWKEFFTSMGGRLDEEVAQY
jgi:hypothetical protein